MSRRYRCCAKCPACHGALHIPSSDPSSASAWTLEIPPQSLRSAVHHASENNPARSVHNNLLCAAPPPGKPLILPRRTPPAPTARLSLPRATIHRFLLHPAPSGIVRNAAGPPTRLRLSVFSSPALLPRLGIKPALNPLPCPSPRRTSPVRLFRLSAFSKTGITLRRQRPRLFEIPAGVRASHGPRRRSLLRFRA
jgi:hypothetical protein